MPVVTPPWLPSTSLLCICTNNELVVTSTKFHMIIGQPIAMGLKLMDNSIGTRAVDGSPLRKYLMPSENHIKVHQTKIENHINNGISSLPSTSKKSSSMITKGHVNMWEVRNFGVVPRSRFHMWRHGAR